MSVEPAVTMKRQNIDKSMKKTLKTALVLGAIAGAAWSAAAQYNGDLIIGFTGGGSATDFLYDLGPASSLAAGETFNLGSLLSGFALSSTKWGVVGTANVGGTRTSWATADPGFTPPMVTGLSQWTKVNTAVTAIAGNFATFAAGQHTTVDPTTDNSWKQQTSTPSLTTQYQNVYGWDPNIGASITGGASGIGTMFVWTESGFNTTLSQLGSLSLDGTGTVTFVPEPTTYSLLAGLGLLALSIRRTMQKA
jgi:hypothetical protein